MMLRNRKKCRIWSGQFYARNNGVFPVEIYKREVAKKTFSDEKITIKFIILSCVIKNKLNYFRFF